MPGVGACPRYEPLPGGMRHRLSRPRSIDSVPVNRTGFDAKLLANHTRRGIRRIAPSRRHTADQNLPRRVQPKTGERQTQIPGDGFDLRALGRLGVDRIDDHRLAGSQGRCRLFLRQ